MRLIGLTGGIATGKTTVAKFLASKYGVPIINVDDVSRSVTEVGSPVLGAVVKAFGSVCLKEDGSLNRPYLSNRIIANDEDRKTLENIIVPAIVKWVSDSLQKLENDGHEFVVVENALMVEQGTYTNYDDVIVVTCSKENQLSRLMLRDGRSLENAKAFIKLQYPLEDKEKIATYLIINNDDATALEKEVDTTWNLIQKT